MIYFKSIIVGVVAVFAATILYIIISARTAAEIANASGARVEVGFDVTSIAGICCSRIRQNAGSVCPKPPHSGECGYMSKSGPCAE